MRLFRGQQVTFSKALKDSNGNPINPATRVTARVLSPLGTEVSSGPASYNLDTRQFEYRFIIPLDADFSTLDKSWTIDWSFTLEDGQVLDIVVEFDVVAENEKLPENSILLNAKTLETVEFFIPEKAQSILLEMLDGSDAVVYTATGPSAFEVVPVEEGYIYMVKIDTTAYPVDDYLFRLTTKIPSKRSSYIEIVQARIVPNVFWHLYPSLDSLLNKLRKRSSLVYSYTKSDIYEYIRRGISMLNLIPPQTTGWTIESIPLGGKWHGGNDLSHYVISAAALWGLQAQLLMYGELNFDFTGQTIGLSYNSSDAVGRELEFLMTQINEQFPRAKELYLRQAQRTVQVAVRRQFFDSGLSRLDTLRRALDIRMNYINSPLSMRYPV